MENVWGIDEEELEKEVESQEERQAEYSPVMAGIYPVTIDKAYLAKSPGGATSFNLEMTEIDPENPLGGRQLYYTGWIKSGDEKGNKATYTGERKNKDTGKMEKVEIPLPSWYEVNHFLKSVGVKLSSLKPQPMKLERFGKIEEVGAFPELTGKKTKAVIRLYEDDHTGEIKERYEVVDFLNMDGSATGKGRNEEDWEKILAKNPIRKLKKKVDAKKEDLAKEAEEAVKGWG